MEQQCLSNGRFNLQRRDLSDRWSTHFVTRSRLCWSSLCRSQYARCPATKCGRSVWFQDPEAYSVAMFQFSVTV